MDKRIKEAFETITADDALKERTYEYVMQQAGKGKKFSRLTRALSVAAAAAVALMFALGIYSYGKETAYISIDINPSIALAVNSFDRVISANAYNDEGKKITESLDLKGKPYADAVKMIMDSPEMTPYLDKNQNMWVAVQTDNPANTVTIEHFVQKAIDTAIKQRHCNTNVEYSCVDEQTRIGAEQNGMTATKYTAILELQSYDNSVSLDEYRHHSMVDINSQIATHHGHSTDVPNYYAGHHGHGS